MLERLLNGNNNNSYVVFAYHYSNKVRQIIRTNSTRDGSYQAINKKQMQR